METDANSHYGHRRQCASIVLQATAFRPVSKPLGVIEMERWTISVNQHITGCQIATTPPSLSRFQVSERRTAGGRLSKLRPSEEKCVPERTITFPVLVIGSRTGRVDNLMCGGKSYVDVNPKGLDRCLPRCLFLLSTSYPLRRRQYPS